MIHTVLASIPACTASAAAQQQQHRSESIAPLQFQPNSYPNTSTSSVENNHGRVLQPAGAPLEIKNDDPLPTPVGPSSTITIGTVCGTRSGDKGGDANLGVYARNDKAGPY